MLAAEIETFAGNSHRHGFKCAFISSAGSKPLPTSTSYREPNASLRTIIQQATGTPSLLTVVRRDVSVALATVPPMLEPGNSSSVFEQGMTSRTKIGLGMIPVVICICTMWMLFLFWWRKRRVHRATRHTNLPFVPQKDRSLVHGSIDSNRRSSKVFRMAAFSTPVNDGRFSRVQALDHSRWRNQTARADQCEKDEINTTMARVANTDSTMNNLDSPIGGSSPFRLKRGDTVKRCSLGTEISSRWPSPPPPSAWVKRATVTDRDFHPRYPGKGCSRDRSSQ